jgi:hypothetical protein
VVNMSEAIKAKTYVIQSQLEVQKTGSNAQ